MEQILLLKPNDIPRLTSLSGNIDVDKIAPHVFTAQVNDIKRVLGADLYDKILTDYDADNLTGVYKIIYEDYVLMALAYYSSSYFIGMGAYQIVNNGIVKMTIDGGTAIDLKENQLLAEKYKQMAVNFENQLITYLGTLDIPEYTNENKVVFKRIIPWY